MRRGQSGGLRRQTLAISFTHDSPLKRRLEWTQGQTASALLRWEIRYEGSWTEITQACCSVFFSFTQDFSAYFGDGNQNKIKHGIILIY